MNSIEEKTNIVEITSEILFVSPGVPWRNITNLKMRFQLGYLGGQKPSKIYNFSVIHQLVINKRGIRLVSNFVEI